MISQIRAIDKKQLVGPRLGDFPPDIMNHVDNGLRVILALV